MPILPPLNRSLPLFRLPPLSGYEEPTPDVLFPEDEQQSFGGALVGAGLSGLGAIGNLLDLPGSMVRDILGLHNPLDQLLSPFSGEDRTSGRDLLEQYGLLRPNKPGLDWGDVGGFVGEVALDPLTYLSFGGSALGKAGQAAKAAGLMDDLTRVASKAAGRRVGPRVARMTRTAEDLLKANPAKRAAFETAARKMGLDPAVAATEKLGGLAGYGLPLGKTRGVIGTGPRAEKLAGYLDLAGDALRYGNIPGTRYSPGRHLAQVMSAPVKGRSTRQGQEAAARLTRLQEEGIDTLRAKEYELLQPLIDAGRLSPDDGGTLRSMMEEVIPTTADPLLGATAGDMGSLLARSRGRMGLRGLPDDPLEDIVGYAPRYAEPLEEMSRKAGRGSTGGRTAFQARDRLDRQRLDILKGFRQGTSGLKEVLQDADVDAAITAGRAAKLDVGTIADQVEDIVRQKYSGVIEPEYLGGDGLKHDRIKELANYLADRLPDEARRAGLFTNHPVADAFRKLRADDRKIRAMDVLSETLAENIVKPEYRVPGGPEAMTVEEVLRRVGIQDAASMKQAGRRVLEQEFKLRGLDINALTPDELALRTEAVLKGHLAADVGEDLTGLLGNFRAPEGVSAFGKAWDGYTNLFKAGVLSWPARIMRDATSGHVRSIEAGLLATPLRSAKAAWGLLQGKIIPDAHQIPEVARLLAQRRLPANAENGTKILRQLYATFGPGTKNIYTDVAGMAARGIDPSLDDTLRALPGQQPLSAGKLARMAAGREAGTTLNPKKMRVRGFLGAKETTVAPIAAAEAASTWTDNHIRLTAFVDQLRQGVDPAEAMRRINEAQVNYNPATFTPTESQLKRVFPFYSFFSRNLKYVAKSLAERPGGRTAQGIRAANALRGDDASTPEYVAEGLSIPLASPGEGVNRYVTGLGMMSEDPFTFLGHGPSGALLEGLSRLNPIIKAPLEAATQESFFQAGDRGGRDLEDLDPALGRTLANVIGREEPVPTPRSLEFLLANSPLSRAVTTARTVTDPRKGAFSKALNTLTGVRVTDISPAAQDAVLRQHAQRLMRSLGSKAFTKAYFPDEALEKMTPQQRAQAEQLEALLAELARRAKARREAEQSAQ